MASNITNNNPILNPSLITSYPTTGAAGGGVGAVWVNVGQGQAGQYLMMGGGGGGGAGGAYYSPKKLEPPLGNAFYNSESYFNVRSSTVSDIETTLLEYHLEVFTCIHPECRDYGLLEFKVQDRKVLAFTSQENRDIFDKFWSHYVRFYNDTDVRLNRMPTLQSGNFTVVTEKTYENTAPRWAWIVSNCEPNVYFAQSSPARHWCFENATDATHFKMRWS